MDPRIRNAFDDGSAGIQSFRQIWNPDSPESRIWEELGTVLALGGRFIESGGFMAPYVSADSEAVDTFSEIVITAAGVRIRAAPSLTARSIATVSFAILTVNSNASTDAWQAVEIDGRAGFVASRFARSPIDYRAYFSQRSGPWRMEMFLAGD